MYSQRQVGEKNVNALQYFQLDYNKNHNKTKNLILSLNFSFL